MNRLQRTGKRASGYDRDGLAVLLLRLQQLALDALRLSAADRFLDVGCATGVAVRAAAPAVALAAGVDLAPEMIGQARRCAPAGQLLVVAGARRLPFPAATFTAVLCSTVLHYLDDPAAATVEMARVLAPGGRVVIGDLARTGRSAAGWHRIRKLPLPGLTEASHRELWTPLGRYTIVAARRQQL